MKNPCRFFRFFEKIRVKKKLMTSFSKVGGYEGFQPLTKIYMFNLSRRFSVLTKSQGLELISSIREACKNKRWFFLFSRDIRNTAPQPLLSSNAQTSDHFSNTPTFPDKNAQLWALGFLKTIWRSPDLPSPTNPCIEKTKHDNFLLESLS